MSNAIKAIVGVVAIVVGVIYEQPWLVSLGASMLLNAAVSQFFGPKAPSAPPLQGVAINYSGTLEPRRILYGTLKIGGMNCMPPLTSGDNNDYIHQVLAFTGEQCSGFGDVFFDQVRIPTGDIAAVTGGAGDGLLSGGSTAYINSAWIRRYDGTQTAVDFKINAAIGAWDSSHVGFGLSYAALTLKYDQTVYTSGFPQATFVVKGKKIYDPRFDSTNGGSGSQRYTTPSTWTYSTNPALALRDYLTSQLGLGEAQTRVDDVLVSAAASVCDQLVAVPIPVLTGLTNWTSGSNLVHGINTLFQMVLGVGTVTTVYLKAPNGTMVQASAINNDTQITLAANYAGATASNQVTQYNLASNATQINQRRYSCNTLLDATATFASNIAQLAGAMMGHCLYSAGKWRMYAGGWSGSAFTLGPDDIVGSVSVQCSAPRANLYNAVRGNFIDPQSNYQPVEFPPILDASYSTDDGETIYVETNFPCCIDLFEAQRNAIIWNRLGRNQKVVSVQCAMSAFGIRPYETGTITIPELGWTSQTVRCIGWRFDPRGQVELSLQEIYQTQFDDPLVTDYVIKGVNVGPAAGRYLPYPPTALVPKGVDGGIVFTVTLPDQIVPGMSVQLFESATASPFSGATRIAVATSDTFAVAKFDQVTRYYWARTVGPNGEVSTTFPTGTGVPAAAALPLRNFLNTRDWIPNTAPPVGYWGEVHSNTGSSNAFIFGDGTSVAKPLGPFEDSETFWRAIGGTGGNGAVGITNFDGLAGFDSTKSYRLSCWFGYTGTGSGQLYFGGDTSGSVKNLNAGTVDVLPYFTYGNVSALTANKWYLLVGVIHGSGYTGADLGSSGAYDPVTMKTVAAFQGYANATNVGDGAEFKFIVGAAIAELRTFIYQCTNVTLQGFFTRPRWEEINDFAPTIPQLLSMSDTAQLAAAAATDVSTTYIAGPLTSTSAAVAQLVLTTGISLPAAADPNQQWIVTATMEAMSNETTDYGGQVQLQLYFDDHNPIGSDAFQFGSIQNLSTSRKPQTLHDVFTPGTNTGHTYSSGIVANFTTTNSRTATVWQIKIQAELIKR